MARTLRPALMLASALLLLGAGGCAPVNTNTTYTPASIGAPAELRRGTILALRPVRIGGYQTGAGVFAGSLTGSLIGSSIGGGWRGSILGAVVGGIIGAGVGGATEQALTSGTAVEFLIRPAEGGPDFAVVQTNELALGVGEPVVVELTDHARLFRAADFGPAAPTDGYRQKS